MNYLDKLNSEVKEYFKILSPEFPGWLLEYIDTPPMKRIDKISLMCGMNYTKYFDIKYFYSNLDHSVGVALIIWNFTRDKKQTLAGLFHDIATPAFKHCIDFMNGDFQKQESTEEKTTEIIKSSKEIMALLNRDNIEFEEINDYKIYPLADNEAPKLSADRLEYNFSCGLHFKRVWNLKNIKEAYNDLTIVQNEDNVIEMAFKNIKICEKYISTIVPFWYSLICDFDRTAMQFIADTCKYMQSKNYLTVEDLYKYSEQEIIDIIVSKSDNCIRNKFLKFQNNINVFTSKDFKENKYCVKIKAKYRYVNPLAIVNGKPKRITDASIKIKNIINKYFKDNIMDYYTYFDIDPFKEE